MLNHEAGDAVRNFLKGVGVASLGRISLASFELGDLFGWWTWAAC